MRIILIEDKKQLANIKDNESVITITDTGIGISEKEKKEKEVVFVFLLKRVYELICSCFLTTF